MTSSLKADRSPSVRVRTAERRRGRIRVTAGPRPKIGIPTVPEGIWRNPVFRIALLLFGLMVVIAMSADLVFRIRRGPRESLPAAGPEALVLGIRDRIYRDPGGRFQITVPAGWQVLGPQDGGYHAVFRGPLNLECQIRVTPLSHDRFDRLLEDIYAIEEQWGVRMNIQARTEDGRPLVERRVRLLEQHVLAFDFLDGPIGHHIQFGAPRNDFERFEPLFRDIFATYLPLRPDGPSSPPSP